MDEVACLCLAFMYLKYIDAQLHYPCGNDTRLHLCYATHALGMQDTYHTVTCIEGDKRTGKNKQMASSGLCNPFLPSAIISSTVTWCRPTVKARPMKLPPAWLDPELLPPPPEPGPELTNSRRESKNFLIVSK